MKQISVELNQARKYSVSNQFITHRNRKTNVTIPLEFNQNKNLK